jgi:ATP-binding cassette subfamily F protein 3
MIHLSKATKRQGQRVLFGDANMHIRAQDRIGLVGPNGAGKTTVFRLIVGQDSLDGGNLSIANNTVVGYFSQDVGDMAGKSALEQVMAGAGKVSALAGEISEIEAKFEKSAENPLPDHEMTALIERYGEIQSEFQMRGGYDLEARAQAILTGLGIGPDDYNRPVESFSGGWKMRIALASILTLNPDVLLMDEPTNHLDVESIIWLEEWLKSFPGALLMTSHDREFLNRSIKRIVEVANGAMTSYSGNYEFYLKDKQLRLENLMASARKQQDMLAKEEEFIARFGARASHAAQVQSRVKKLEKIDRIEVPSEMRTVQFHFDKPARSGTDVIKMESLGKVWDLENGKQKSIFGGVTGVVRRMDKIAVTGVNGAGKSTLLKVLLGLTPASTGQATMGANVQVGYFSQHALDLLNKDRTILEELTESLPALGTGTIRSLLGAFLFSGDDVEKKISVLSGGERSRVVLAIMLARLPNLLILDEPTNHLDIDSREVLLETLKEFEGTVMIVSHDRHFLREISTRVFEVSHGSLNIYEGNYDYYLSKKENPS